MDYFDKFVIEEKTISEPLQKLFNGDNTSKFHFPLGKNTPEMLTTLHQIYQFNNDWSLNHGFRYKAQNYQVNTVLPFNFNEVTGDLTRFFANRAFRSDDYSINTSVVGEFETGNIKHQLVTGIDFNFNRFDDQITKINTSIPTTVNIFNPIYGDHSFGLWSSYQIQQGDLEGLGLGLGFNYVGKRAGDLDNSFYVDGYFITNMAIFYEKNDWRVGLNINNLFNTEYISSTNNARLFGNSPGQPFSVIGSVSVKF
ncbi:MAG: TonB-dependent receptor [Cyanobacterium sp. T60_A2020_053]|nr:TonB-dependent receptor [Cyanobacterium sp. T60_A2020_053]